MKATVKALTVSSAGCSGVKKTPETGTASGSGERAVSESASGLRDNLPDNSNSLDFNSTYAKYESRIKTQLDKMVGEYKAIN